VIDKNETEREETSKKTTEPQRITTLAEAQAEAVAAAKAARAGEDSEPPTAPKTERKIHRVIPLAEADATQEALYAKRQRVYPREVHGVLANWRVAMVFVTLGIYYFLPWLNWDGRQAFLIDLPNRKFNFFFWTFWPQDLFYLTAILVISALSLFLFTAVAGRLWCGYTCPQTVWTEAFLWIERKIEGDRNRQMKLAASRWTGEKIAKRAAKHAVWGLFALWTGFTFVGYVTPIRELTLSVWNMSLGPWEIFWILFYGFATYGNAGWMREQVCIYMCPYARFQSAMFDRDTLIISYDTKRGEPRGSRARKEDYKGKGLGDCVDCTLCVQVCPTGIDIRNGLQYQCIACGACVDVCNSVMDKMGYPQGLIRYTTQNELELGKPRQLLRPRVLVYMGLLGAITAGLVAAVLMRIPLELDVIRDRNTLYREGEGGRIENVYTLKIMNMDGRDHSYRLSASGIEEIGLRMDKQEIPVASGEVVELPVTLTADPAWLKERSTRVSFTLQAIDNEKLKRVEEARFLGPGK
jgi:cytochrome c oxidase accessory protein FixG